ncbi:alpha-L-fucosidase [Parabacteroides sp. AF18-52]|uniref:alpha-L-fucosidase n=1 Tax=Parabacteroides TaxID=375288 RepID=UPI000EFF1FF7|nr:alpha-L-fucosidase [Parabacteroides sp. AF18-52]RHR43275.1 alpha-L-fucosidase [Parabacteroides sp. AF18-52]
MKNLNNLLLGLAFCSLLSCGNQQKEIYVTSCLFPEGVTADEKARLAAHVVPSDRQLEWQQMEFTCFICYGVNTFTDAEWGTGKEDPSVFNPTELDARQWARTAKDAGMKMILLTCKHHDGFCLWPSAYTDFSVASTPWKDGQGDLVREVADACKEYGLKFAVYLSPWDMNHPDYGTEQYNDYFVNQLTELLTQYGRVDEVWFDGACGEGPNGKKQEYDFMRYYELIRRLQPQAVIAVMGPDVRWVGTESGYGRDTEWSVLPAAVSSLTAIAESSQQETGSGTFLPEGDKMAQDLGSRTLLADARGVIWYPSEVDVSIRPGWYYHASEDTSVKTPQKLIDIYYSSIGKNSLLLLNLPPDKRGLIHENDISSLMNMKRILGKTFEKNLLKKAVSSTGEIGDLTDGRLETYWQGSGKTNTIEISFEGEEEFDRLLLQENITEGQRIERFTLECQVGDTWQMVTEGTTVGYKRILRFAPVRCNKVRIVVSESRDLPQLSEIGFYKASEEEQK